MKIRQGFVSNSSSSSFVISKSALTPVQLKMIVEYQKIVKCLKSLGLDTDILDLDHADGGWNIILEENHISGDTSMDNFNMQGFMHQIGVPAALIKWEEGHW